MTPISSSPTSITWWPAPSLSRCLAALYYWLPLLTGRTAVHRLSVPAFWLIFVGFNLTFFLMHLVGLLGMPRRIYTYRADEGWIWLNLLSSVGGFIMTIGFALVVIDLIAQIRYGRRVRRDPWGAATLEWAMPIPPAPYAFASIPSIDTRADRIAASELAPSLARGEGYLGFARNGWQETLGVHMTSGEPEQLIVLPRPTYLPLWTALRTARRCWRCCSSFTFWPSSWRWWSPVCSCWLGTERRSFARLRSDARRPWRQRAAAYRGGRSASRGGR